MRSDISIERIVDDKSVVWYQIEKELPDMKYRTLTYELKDGRMFYSEVIVKEVYCFIDN